MNLLVISLCYCFVGQDKVSSNVLKANTASTATASPPAPAEKTIYKCSVCSHIYDAAEDGNGAAFEDLPDTWKCPVCGAPKAAYLVVPPENRPCVSELFHGGNAIFQATGASLSFIAAGIMLIIIGRNKAVKTQVRPRMLLVLAALDTIAGLLVGINTLLTDNDLLGIVRYLDLIGIFFQWSSFTWTCCIARHVYFVIRMVPCPLDAQVEKRQERLYWAIMFVCMVLVFLPLAVYFMWFEEVDLDHGIRHYLLLQATFLCLQWLCVGSFCIRMYCDMMLVESPEARVYRRQVTGFLLIFLCLTAQTAFNQAYFAVLDEFPPSEYLRMYGQSFWYYMGLFNAVVWGVNRRKDCAVACVNTCCDIFCCETATNGNGVGNNNNNDDKHHHYDQVHEQEEIVGSFHRKSNSNSHSNSNSNNSAAPMRNVVSHTSHTRNIIEEKYSPM